jgi:beta-1,4-mannosyl-glycoprotein beta-1,4-N-acetylglucosaminyltransferase
MLELRFRILYDHVDRFVIVEATKTYTGLPREKLLFDINRWYQYADKITYLVYDGYYSTSNSWDNEVYVRGYLRQGLMEANDNDLVILTDADEILDPSILDHVDTKFDITILMLYTL